METSVPLESWKLVVWVMTSEAPCHSALEVRMRKGESAGKGRVGAVELGGEGVVDGELTGRRDGDFDLVGRLGDGVGLTVGRHLAEVALLQVQLPGSGKVRLGLGCGLGDADRR